MSIDDDIFDVSDALEGKPEAESFDRILNVFNMIEQKLNTATYENKVLKEAIRIVREDKENARH